MIMLNPINAQILSLIRKGKRTVREVTESFDCSRESIRPRIISMLDDGLLSKEMKERRGNFGGSREAHYSYTGMPFKVDMKARGIRLKPTPVVSYAAADLLIFRAVA